MEEHRPPRDCCMGSTAHHICQDLSHGYPKARLVPEVSRFESCPALGEKTRATDKALVFSYVKHRPRQGVPMPYYRDRPLTGPEVADKVFTAIGEALAFLFFLWLCVGAPWPPWDLNK